MCIMVSKLEKIWPIKELKEEKSFNEIVASWLKCEWHYPFYILKRKIIPKKIINQPTFSNSENKIRLKLLCSNRGHMIKQLPKDTKWYSIVFKKKDIPRTSLIPMKKGWTFKITKGTCMLKDALNKENWNLINTEDRNRIQNIYSSFKKSISNKEIRLILLASSPNSLFSILEGNHRSVALATKSLENNQKSLIIPSYLGISQKMKRCLLYTK